MIDPNLEFTPYLTTKSSHCHNQTWNHFVEQGDIPSDAKGTSEYCLHHIDPTMRYFDLNRYCEWRIEDVMPLTMSQHTKMHQDFEKREREYGFLSSLMLERAKTL